MSNPLFNALNGGRQMPQNPMQMLSALKSDPIGFIRARGLNIPDGMNNPQQIVQHLLQSGQVPNARYQQVLQNMQQLRR